MNLRNSTIVFVLLFLFVSLFCGGLTERSAGDRRKADGTSRTDIDSLSIYAKQAKQFCVKKKMNSDYFFLIDLNVHSGLKRFCVWDFKRDTIIKSLMVSHGCSKYRWSGTNTKERAEISNVDGTHCSSIGKYKIGERGFSNWGINVKYLLHGLESTNDNALARQIVLHGWDGVTDEEVFPNGTPEGWGCPAVSNKGMTYLDSLLSTSSKPVLLWVVQ